MADFVCMSLLMPKNDIDLYYVAKISIRKPADKIFMLMNPMRTNLFWTQIQLTTATG